MASYGVRRGVLGVQAAAVRTDGIPLFILQKENRAPWTKRQRSGFASTKAMCAAWFYRILRNHCLNRIAGRQTAARYEDRLAVETAATRPVEEPDFLLEAREEQAQVWDALSRIKAEFRDYDGIAQRLHIPRGTVMSRLYHARRAFAAQYSN